MNSVMFAQETGASAWSSIIFLGVMVLVFYFLIIRPQRRRAQAQRKLSESLEVGIEIRTIGGIHGTVVSMDNDTVVLKVEDGQLRVSKRAIGSRVGDEG